MKRFDCFLIILLVIYGSTTYSQDLFFSEYTANGYTNVLEVFNPTKDTIDLNGYSIVRNGAFRFDFPGGELPPGDTWVGCRNEPDNPPDHEVLAVADTSWPAAGSIWYFSSNAMLELLKNDVVIDKINGDPKNGTVAGVEGALDKGTLIRKRLIYQGETDWDVSRGSNAEDSQWNVMQVTYTDLKKHTFTAPDAAVVWSDWFDISVGGEDRDTIFFVPVNYTGIDLLEKIEHVPGSQITFYRGPDQLDETEILEQFDKLVVSNVDQTDFHTYVIFLGNYNYMKESVIISEVLYTQILRAIEICNVTSDVVEMTGWGIGKNNAVKGGAADEYTAFPDGLILQPGETFVIGYIYDKSLMVHSENVITFAEFVLPYFDIYEKGAANLNVLGKINSSTSFTLLDPFDKIIDRFQPGQEKSTIDGTVMAFNNATLIRKPFVNSGEPVWFGEKEANPETTTWTWKPHSYLDLGQHITYKHDTAFVQSDLYTISEGALADSIFPVRLGITVSELLDDITAPYAWTIQLMSQDQLLSADDTIAEGSVLEVLSTDLSFTKPYDIVFGRSDLELSSESSVVINDTIVCTDLYTTATTLLKKLSAPDGGTLAVVNGIGNVRSGFVNVGDKVLVTAEDLSQKYYYIDFQFSSEYTLVRSPFYHIDTIQNIISGIPDGEDSEFLKGNLIAAEGQQIDILNSQYQQVESISSGDLIRITSPGGLEREYSIITSGISPTKQVWDDPTITNMPPVLNRSDVYLRNLRPRTEESYQGPVNPESGKPWETMDALKGFHCTQLRWVTSTLGKPDFIDMVQDAGYIYQGSVNPHGNLLKDDNYYEPQPGVVGDQVCPNKPGTMREYFNSIRTYLNKGSEGLTFHSDGARWLMPDGMNDIQVCFCDYCNAKRDSHGIQYPITLEGKQFMYNSMMEVLDTVHRHFEDLLGRKIEWSGNNSSWHRMNEIIVNGYTTAYGEVIATEIFSTPGKWINDFRTAERNGILQAFQICSKEIDDDTKSDDVLNTEQYEKFVCINRSHFAFAYAAGGLASVPWDSYTGTDQTRHFGLFSEFADLSGFIRGIGPYLDGYESGFDYFMANGDYVGSSYIDPRFSSSELPLEVEGNDNAVVFVRVKPGDESAPIMIHLTEWFHIYESNAYYKPYMFETRDAYTLKIRRSSFFDGAPFSLKLLTPAPYSKAVHDLSALQAEELLIPGEYRSVKEYPAYQNLVREEYLDLQVEGDFIVLEIPKLPHYGVLKLERGLSTSNPLASSRYQVCNNKIIIPEGLAVENLLAGMVTKPGIKLLIQNPEGFNKYSGIISDGDRLAVLFPDQTCEVYYFIPNTYETSLKYLYNEAELIPGQIIDAGKLEVRDSVEFDVRITNQGSDDYVINETVSDNENFRLSLDKDVVKPGETAILQIRVKGQQTGKDFSNLKISGQSCTDLPFYFSVQAEILASEILVRHNQIEVIAGDIIDLGSGRIGDHLMDSIIVYNYGSSLLSVSDISSDSDKLVFNTESLELEPASSATINFQLLIEQLDDIEASLVLRSNSNGPDSIMHLDIIAAGKDAVISLFSESVEVLSGDTIDFGVVMVNDTATTDLFIRNVGNDILEIHQIQISGTAFSIPSFGGNIHPGEADALSVSYIPAAEDFYLDSIQIESNSYRDDNYFVYLKGESLVSGVEPNHGGMQVSAYPNPFSHKFVLRNASEFYQLKILSISGKVLKIINIDNRNMIEIDGSEMEDGLYFIQLSGESGTNTIKITKS
jgi:hypothetical protein